jgi:hypothetical protein
MKNWKIISVMLNYKALAFCFLSIIQITFSQVAAQGGTIEGVITDKSTGETIIGANIIIDGTLTGTSTDLDGKFVLKVAPGTYKIKIMFISYETVLVEGVVVESGKPAYLNVALAEVSTEIEGVQVIARRITNTEGAMISAIRSGNVVIAGITAQQIMRSQDNDAAAVVKRIPGVTIVDDRFILIRGLGERYNPAMLHSSFAPSMEADVKSFSFDVVPSSLIDRIMIYKSPSADLPGDFAGGVVKIFTRSVADKNFINFSYTSGYENGTSLGSFYTQETGKNHWTGLKDTYNDLPAGFPANLRSIASDPVRIQAAGQSLNNNWLPLSINAGLNHSFSISGGIGFGPESFRIGNITALTYSRSRTVSDITRRDYNQYDIEQGVSSVIYDFSDNRNSEKIRTGLLHNWSLSLGSNHKIEFINIFNQLSQSEYTFRTGPMYEFNYYANNHSFYQIFRGIYSGQLTGRHKLSGDKTIIEWSGGLAESYREEPDYRRYRTDLDTDLNSVSIYIPTGAAATYFLGRFYSEMSEHSKSASVNITQKLFADKTGDHAPELSAGIFYDSRSRSFSGRNIGYVRANSTTFDQSLIFTSIDNLFMPGNINSDTGIKIDEQTNPSDSYTSGNDLLAGYAMLKLPIAGSKIVVNTGIRAENNTLVLSSKTLTNEPVDVNDHTFALLPSLNIAYNFTSKSLARLAVGKTLNRAEFRELAPFGFYDFNYNLVRKGNPDLLSASIWNFDLRWELYPSQGEIITAGLFYKDFRNAIELTFLPGGGTAGIKTFIPVNASRASSMGAEIEVRKSLEEASANRFLSRMTLLFNGALIYSKIRPSESGLGNAFRERPMQGQSPFILNTGLYYRDQENGLQVNLLYNIIGRRIMIIGFDEYPDIYEMPRHLAELTITKSIGRYLEVKAGIKDIFNQENLLLQDANLDGKYDRENDQTIERYKTGSIFNIGISLKF